jgi:hypothetical protein
MERRGERIRIMIANREISCAALKGLSALPKERPSGRDLPFRQCANEGQTAARGACARRWPRYREKTGRRVVTFSSRACLEI